MVTGLMLGQERILSLILRHLFSHSKTIIRAWVTSQATVWDGGERQDDDVVVLLR